MVFYDFNKKDPALRRSSLTMIEGAPISPAKVNDGFRGAFK
jgi:hypothetical protein